MGLVNPRGVHCAGAAAGEDDAPIISLAFQRVLSEEPRRGLCHRLRLLQAEHTHLRAVSTCGSNSRSIASISANAGSLLLPTKLPIISATRLPAWLIKYQAAKRCMVGQILVQGGA
jgi:hypothetical protein